MDQAAVARRVAEEQGIEKHGMSEATILALLREAVRMKETKNRDWRSRTVRWAQTNHPECRAAGAKAVEQMINITTKRWYRAAQGEQRRQEEKAAKVFPLSECAALSSTLLPPVGSKQEQEHLVADHPAAHPCRYSTTFLFNFHHSTTLRGQC